MLSDWETLGRIVLSVVLSGLIGIEREFRQKGAGLRTHILVGLGSTLIVLTSLYIFDTYRTIAIFDPTRMISGIVTGIGFLCAGTIIQAESRVMGLTSAAVLWIVSGVGIAVGAGHYIAAVAVSAIVFFVLIVLRSFELRLAQKLKSDHHHNG